MWFEVLGPIRARADSTDIAITANREQVVLAMLLLHLDRFIEQDQLIDAMWTDRPPPSAAAQVHGTVYRLRRRLAAGGIPGEVIATGAAGYKACVDPDQVDLWEFRRLREQARAAVAAGQPGDAYRHYRAGLELWHGSALAGVDSPAVRQAATTLDEERIRTLEERVEVELQLGRAGELVAELTGLAQQFPYRETFLAALMRALYQSGRQADALAAYRRARQAFHDELGTEPGAQLQQLHQAILNRDPSPGGAGNGAGARAADTGRTGSAGPPPAGGGPDATSASRREHGDAGRPAARSRPTGVLPPGELPVDVAGFTGRTGVLRELDEQLAAAAGTQTLIISVAGTAGVGKTALAVHWAHRVRDRFPDGQLYVNLNGYAAGPPAAPLDALARFLHALGVPGERTPVEVEEAAALYRSLLADRRILVVLDNAATVDQVRPLLPGAPGCLVLVTSRDQLGGLVARDGAHRISLEVLVAGEAQALLSHILGPRRAAAEPAAVAELAALCGHLPLALRIAAANLTARPRLAVADYVAELRDQDRLAALAVPGDPGNAMAAAFDLSYDRLPAPARRVFRLLGLAPGPHVTAGAMAALAGCPVDRAGESLQLLARAHLLEERTAGRYTCHDLLRRYAAGRTQAEETEPDRAAARERLLGWYVQATAAATELLCPQLERLAGPRPVPEGVPPLRFSDPASARGWLEAEWTDLVAAVLDAAETGPRRPAYLLADLLRGYCWQGGHTVDWLAIANAALAAAEQASDLPAQAAARLSLGDVTQRRGKYQQAAEHYRRAEGLARQAGWVGGLATVLSNWARVDYSLGRLDRAAERLTEALAVNRRADRPAAQAINLNNLGLVHEERGELRLAAECHTQALVLNRALGAQDGEATVLTNLGKIAHHQGRLAEARGHLRRALALRREHAHRYGEANALHYLAAVHRDAGGYSAARKAAEQAIAIAAELGETRAEAEARTTLGSVELRLGRPATALAEHRRALELVTPSGDRGPEIAARLGVAAAFLELGPVAEASAEAERAQVQATELGFRLWQGHALQLLAEVRLAAGDVPAADRFARQALATHRRAGHRLGEARARLVLGRIRHAAGDPVAAREHWRAARSGFSAVGAPEAGQLVQLIRGEITSADPS